MIGWKQSRRIDPHAGEIRLMLLLFRQVGPETLDRRIRFASIQKDGNHGQLTRGIAMHEMGDHF